MRFSPAPAKMGAVTCKGKVVRRQASHNAVWKKAVRLAHRAANLIELIHADARRGWVWLGGET